MTIAKSGKEDIPTDIKDLDAPATRKRLRSTRSSNRFAPIAPPDDLMETSPGDQSTPLPPTQPARASPDPFRDDTPTPAPQAAPTLTSPTITKRARPATSRGDPTEQAAVPAPPLSPPPPTPSQARVAAMTMVEATPSPPTFVPQTPVSITSRLQAHFEAAAENRNRVLNQALTPRPGAFPLHTPRPINGFPLTHFRQSTQLLENIDAAALAVWENGVITPKLLARIFDHAADTTTPERTQIIVNTMRNVIAGIAYDLQHEGSTEIQIAPPPRAQNAKSAPGTFLVYDVPPSVHDLLLNTRVWSTPGITFEIFPSFPNLPTFLFPLDHFITKECEN